MLLTRRLVSASEAPIASENIICQRRRSTDYRASRLGRTLNCSGWKRRPWVASLEYILENPIVAEVAERTQCAEEAASTDQPSELSIMSRVIPAAEGHICILLCLSAVMDIFCSRVSDTNRGRRKCSALVQVVIYPVYPPLSIVQVEASVALFGSPPNDVQVANRLQCTPSLAMVDRAALNVTNLRLVHWSHSRSLVLKTTCYNLRLRDECGKFKGGTTQLSRTARQLQPIPQFILQPRCCFHC
jgi:hypothetical protein